MINLPEDYLKRETRDGHVVGELIKRAWAAQLEILSKIDAICKKYNLTYYAYWGTLIGAVRHKGFIPWDDDIDIAFKREDYDKFLQVASEELPDGYKVINNYTEDWGDNSLTRVVNSIDISFNDKRMKEYHNCPFAAGIDVFQLDYISRKPEEALEQEYILTYIGMLMTVLETRKEAEKQGESIDVINDYNETIASGLIFLEKLCGVHFENDRRILTQLGVLYDQISALFTADESDKITNIASYMRTGYLLDKKLFEETLYVPFENIQIPVPSGYDEILRKTYGEYMIPVKGGSTHGNICYEPQTRLLAQKIDVLIKEQVEEELVEAVLEQVKSEVNKQENKKVILVHNDTFGTISHDATVVKKLKEVFEILTKDKNIIIWWRPSRINHPNVKDIEKVMPQMIEEYKELVDEFCQKKWGIYDNGFPIGKVLECCDAYYGDDNKVAKVFSLSNKPVMIIDYNM